MQRGGGDGRRRGRPGGGGGGTRRTRPAASVDHAVWSPDPCNGKATCPDTQSHSATLLEGRGGGEGRRWLAAVGRGAGTLRARAAVLLAAKRSAVFSSARERESFLREEPDSLPSLQRPVGLEGCEKDTGPGSGSGGHWDRMRIPKLPIYIHRKRKDSPLQRSSTDTVQEMYTADSCVCTIPAACHTGKGGTDASNKCRLPVAIPAHATFCDASHCKIANMSQVHRQISFAIARHNYMT